MQLEPDQPAIPADEVAVPASSVGPRRSFGVRLLGLAFTIFCFEIGVFLLVFPWMPIWENNMLPAFAPWLEDLWGNPYFRGALSGLGLVDIYISFMEMVRLVKG